MSYKGSMEGWSIDDEECNGHCGSCDECLYVIEKKGDSDYEAERNEQ